MGSNYFSARMVFACHCSSTNHILKVSFELQFETKVELEVEVGTFQLYNGRSIQEEFTQNYVNLLAITYLLINGHFLSDNLFQGGECPS